MGRVSSILLVAIGVVAVAVLFGCSDSGPWVLRAPPTLGGAARATLADCPDELRERVRVAASAMAISLPDGLSAQPGTTQPGELVARRLLVSASLTGGAAAVRVRGSTLTVTTVGGTFAGPASVVMRSNPPEVARDRALEVIPGRVRVEPFLSSSKLHPETIVFDVALIPGGVPVDKMIVSLSPLWTPERHPVAPDTLQITLSSERHLTVFDVVEAHVSLDVDGTGPARSHDTWECSYETHFTLVDHDSVLPEVWDLHTVPRDGRHKRWLALFAPAVGPFRVIFTNAQAAQAFATWLRTTGATHAGGYQLGLFERDADRSQATIPADRDIASTFQPVSVDEAQGLVVGRLGEN